MRKIVVHMQVTLDNRISNGEGGFWTPFPFGDEEMAYVNDAFRNADTFAMSGKVYQFVIPYWEQVAAGTAPDIGVADSPARSEFARLQLEMTKVVFSRTLTDDPRTRRVVLAGDVETHLRNLKEGAGRDIVLACGPAMLGPLVTRPGLIDEFFLIVHPAVISTGPRLLEHADSDIGLKLVDSRVFDGGALALRYTNLAAG